MLSMLDRARDRGPADHRREGAGRAADDDVLRRAPLQPHRVDEDVEGDGEGEQRAGHPVDQQPEREHRADRQHHAEGERLVGRDASRAGWAGSPCAACSASMSASYHMLSAPDAPAPTAMQISAMTASAGCGCPAPAPCRRSAVNTTSDITRGFISATKSPTLPPDGLRGAQRARLVTELSHGASHARTSRSAPLRSSDARSP